MSEANLRQTDDPKYYENHDNLLNNTETQNLCASIINRHCQVWNFHLNGLKMGKVVHSF